MINFTSENILRFIKKFSDFDNQAVECFTEGEYRDDFHFFRAKD